MDSFVICTCSLRGMAMVRVLKREEMIENIQLDIECMREEIRIDFLSIALTQKHIRIAESAIEHHKKEGQIDDLLYFCVNGSYPDE